MSEKPQRTVRVVAAVIERDGRYLITQRRPNAVLPMLWEFPGGRCEEGESDEEALVREVDERLGARVKVAPRWVSFTSATYEKYTVDFYLYECELLTEELACRAVHDFRWVRSDEFDNYDFTPVDEASINQLLGES